MDINVGRSFRENVEEVSWKADLEVGLVGDLVDLKKFLKFPSVGTKVLYFGVVNKESPGS